MSKIQIITRKQAKELGLKRYFTGAPCSHGHLSERMVSNKRCVECHRISAIALRGSKPEVYKKHQNDFYARNSDLIKERAAQRYSESPEYWQEWHVKNKASQNARSAKWSFDNSERMRFLEKRWRDNNKEKCRTKSANRRALILSAGGYHSEADIFELMIMQYGRCGNCYCDLGETGYHVDHIVPISRGGDNWPTNLQILCPRCNLRKSDKMPEDFY